MYPTMHSKIYYTSDVHYRNDISHHALESWQTKLEWNTVKLLKSSRIKRTFERKDDVSLSHDHSAQTRLAGSDQK